MPLLVTFVLGPIPVDSPERPRVGHPRIVPLKLRQRFVRVQVRHERVFARIRVVGLTVKRDEVSETVIERVPKVGNTTRPARVRAWHAKPVLVSRKVAAVSA